MEEDERAFVARLIERDAEAEEAFVLRYRDRLYRVAVAFLGFQDPEAEDVVQESLISALKALPSFEFRSTLYTWLNQICVRQCFRRLRERKRTVVGLDTSLAELLGASTAGDEAPLKLMEEARRRVLAQAMRQLETPCREVVAKRDLEGMSYAALSKALRAPMGTVMSRLSRCREQLKRIVMDRLEREARG